MSDRKSILIAKNSHKILVELAKKHKMNYQGFVEEMLNYFKKTGQDPRMNISKSPSEVVNILDKRVVSFFKTQERDILKPLRNEVYENSKRNEALIIELSTSIKDAFIKSNQNHTDELNDLLESIKSLIN